MAEITITSITPGDVETAITKGIYNMLFYDRLGLQQPKDICQTAIDSAFSTIQSKASKAKIDLSNLTDDEAGQIETAFLYLVESEGHGYNLNEGSYRNKRKQAVQLLIDLWGNSASDTPTDNANNGGFISASVTPLTYTAKEAKLFDNALWD